MPGWTGYHVKTDGRAYFRPYIPKELKAILGPLPMVNLGVKASRAAERLALSHYIAHEALLADTRQELLEAARRPRKKPLGDYTGEDLQGFATQLAQGFNRVQHAAIKAGNPRSELESLHDLLTQVAGDVLSASGSEGLGNVTELFLHAAAIPYTRAEPNFRALVFEFATALDTEFSKPGTRRLYGREAVAPPPLPEAPQSAAAPPAQLTLGTVVERHLRKANQKKSQYTRKVVRCLTLFREVIGADTPVTAIRQLHVTDFLGDICKLPSDWARRFDKGTVTIAAMLAEDTAEVISPLTYTDNYRAPLKAFLRDSRRDYGDEGFPVLIVDGIEYSGDRMAGEDKQRALSVPELKTFFEGPRFAAMAVSPEQECMYWFSTLLLFTGARPRELCQTNPQVDFGQEEDHWYIDLDLHTAAGKGIVKTIKTGEERRIPIHPELIRLGFPEYVQRLKASGADRLFPAFRVKKGNPFEAAGDGFTALLKDMVLISTKS
ncbi:hypothetical protein [Polaromonas sp. YR568]|uniref:hypothetical protein n=1 Tax=Polaromonas sp. YR568 TaxID=1855301 RepID=UPI003137DC2A